jgi:phage terminase small subunit
MTEPTPDAPASTLTPKQRRFVEEYLIDLNGTQAAIRAGYSADSARSIAHENLTKLDIARAIDEALAKDAGVTRPRIVSELAKIAFARPKDYFAWGPDGVTVKASEELNDDQAAAIAEVSQTITPAGGTIRVKLSDKLTALEKLGKALGLFKDRHEHSGKDGVPLGPILNVTYGVTPTKSAQNS